MSFNFAILLELIIFVSLSHNFPIDVNTTTTNQSHQNVTSKKFITTSAVTFQPPPLPLGVFEQNDVKIGKCTRNEKKYIVHNENIQIESTGPSTLSGVIEIYIDAPIKINCVEVFDKMPPGTGASVSLKDGGPGYNWIFINYQGKYARGINIVVIAYGVADYTKLNNIM